MFPKFPNKVPKQARTGEQLFLFTAQLFSPLVPNHKFPRVLKQGGLKKSQTANAREREREREGAAMAMEDKTAQHVHRYSSSAAGYQLR
jgi:hypothetical protein